MFSYEYHQLLKFLYFEGYANSYEEAEYLLEELNDDELYDLCEKISAADPRKPQSPRTTFFPKSREGDIGKHDDWKDPHPDTRDWGERPPAANKLKRRTKAVVSTQWRQDRETGVVREGFKDLTPEKEERVRTRMGELLQGTLNAHDEVMKLKNKPFARYRPGVRRRATKLRQDARKIRQFAQNATDALSRTDASRRASIIHQQNQLKQQLRDLGADPDAPDDSDARSNIRRFRREEYILEYLIDCGYTNNYDSAIKIYEAMSEEWLYSILQSTESNWNER